MGHVGAGVASAAEKRVWGKQATDGAALTAAEAGLGLCQSHWCWLPVVAWDYDWVYTKPSLTSLNMDAGSAGSCWVSRILGQQDVQGVEGSVWWAMRSVWGGGWGRRKLEVT